MDWFKSKKSFLPQAENGYNALQLLCGGQYDLLKWILQKAEIKKKNQHLLNPMLEHLQHLKDELNFGFGYKQASESFQYLVQVLSETFHVPLGDVTQVYHENLLDLLLSFFRQKFRELEEESRCIGQHCSALAHRVAVLLMYGLKPPPESFCPIFLYLCFEHRYQIQDILCNIGLLKHPDYRANPNIFSLPATEKSQSFSSAMDLLPDHSRFPNYLRWCLALTERVTGEVSSSVVINLAKFCRTRQNSNSEDADNPMDVFPDEVFTEMTCDGQTVFSMTVLTENTVFLKLLILRSTFDPGCEVSRDQDDLENFYLGPLLGHTVSRKTESKGRKILRRKSSEKTKPERPLSICSARSVEHKLSKMSRNALQEVLKKKWLPGWKLLLQHRRAGDVELYQEVLFEIIEERWFEGLKVYCEDLSNCADNEEVNKEQFLNLNHENAQGSTPLHLALENKWTQGAQYLIRHPDVEINHPSQSGQTPLHLAMDKDMVEVVLDILRVRKQDVDINTTDGQYRTVIHKALCKGHSEVIKLLLDFKNLNLRSPDSKGNPPVHAAVLMEHTALNAHDLQATMRHKSFDIEARDREGRTLEKLIYREKIHDDLRKVIEKELEPRCRQQVYLPYVATPDSYQMSVRRTSSTSSCVMEYPDCIRQALTQKRCELLDNMTPNRIVDMFLQESVLNSDEQAKLDGMLDRDKSSFLIQKVWQNPVRHYGPFIHGLRYAGQSYLADMLASEIQEMLIDQTSPFHRGSVQHLSARYTNERVPYRPEFSFMSPQANRKRYTLAAHQEDASHDQIYDSRYLDGSVSSARHSRRCSCSSNLTADESTPRIQPGYNKDGPWVLRNDYEQTEVKQLNQGVVDASQRSTPENQGQNHVGEGSNKKNQAQQSMGAGNSEQYQGQLEENQGQRLSENDNERQSTSSNQFEHVL